MQIGKAVIQWYTRACDYGTALWFPILRAGSVLKDQTPAWGHIKDFCSQRSCPPWNGGKGKCYLHIVPIEQTHKPTQQYDAIVSHFVCFLSALYPWQDSGCPVKDQSNHISSLLVYIHLVLTLPFFLVNTPALPCSSSGQQLHHLWAPHQNPLVHEGFCPKGCFMDSSQPFRQQSLHLQRQWLLKAVLPVPGSGAIGALSGHSRKCLASALWPSAKTRPPLAGIQHKVNRVSQPDFKQQNNWEIWLTAPGFQIQNMEVPRSKNPLWILRHFGC